MRPDKDDADDRRHPRRVRGGSDLADNSRPLRADDIINIDITIYLNGYHGDTSATFALPGTDAAGLDLVEATRQALHIGIEQCGPGKPYAGIGQAIE